MTRLIGTLGVGLLAVASCGDKNPPAASGDPTSSENVPAASASRSVSVSSLPDIQRGVASNPKVTFGIDTSTYSAPESVAKLEAHGCAMLEAGWTPKTDDIALIIGVGDYKVSVNGKSLDLQGPPNDAWKMVELLEGHYGFKPHDVCALTNASATYANVHKAFTVLSQTAGEGDNVTIFFAGHGSQAVDWDGAEDEEDGKDETFMLHDSRAGEVMDLRDDEMNQYLFAVHETGAYVTMLVDACNSGSASRDISDSPSVKRQAIYAEYPKPEGWKPGDPAAYSPELMERLVYISAARDGTSAEESGGEGYFTKAVIYAIQKAGGHPTWAQLPEAVQTLVSEKSNQLVTFEGDLNRRVFTTREVERPLSWEVKKIEGDVGIVTLKGPALPGWTEGAVLDIYQGDLSVEDLKSEKTRAAKLKGTAKVTTTTPFEAEAVFKASELSSPIALGDVALLNTPGLTDKIKVKIQKQGDGALDPKMVTAVQGAVKEFKDANMTVEWVDSGADLLLTQEGKNLYIYDAQGVRRNEMTPPGSGFGDEAIELKAAQNLAQHARQRYLLSLTKGVDNVGGVIDVKVIAPQTSSDPYCVGEHFQEVGGDELIQPVPLCDLYALELTVVDWPKDADGQPLFPQGIHVGVLALWSDSGVSAYPMPARGQQGWVPVLFTEKGQSKTVPIGSASPPAGATEHFVIFGTPDKIDWSMMEVKAKRAAGAWPDFGPTLGSWTASYVGVTGQLIDGVLGPEDDINEPTMCDIRASRVTRNGRLPCPE
ncbi:MAG: caspase family protein [Alphaproteobacteria bacterium]|nr:caspase family protein [Alphaproteobacteria bacterium]